MLINLGKFSHKQGRNNLDNILNIRRAIGFSSAEKIHRNLDNIFSSLKLLLLGYFLKFSLFFFCNFLFFRDLQGLIYFFRGLNARNEATIQKNDRNGGVWQSRISKSLAEYVQRRVQRILYLSIM